MNAAWLNRLNLKHFQPAIAAKEAAVLEAKDAVTCIKTATWAEFKDRLRARAKATRWTRGMTNEMAASSLIANTVYNEVLDEIEDIERSAARKVENVRQS